MVATSASPRWFLATIVGLLAIAFAIEALVR
jgi:hypothetical protein